MSAKGFVTGINGNMVSARFEGPISMNEIAFVAVSEQTLEHKVKLKAEVIRIRGSFCDMQVFEDTRGISVNATVLFSGELLSIELGPGLLGCVYDGLGNPLEELAKKAGYFLHRGVYLHGLDRAKKWRFTPLVSVGTWLGAGQAVGFVPEGEFTHRIMIPFDLVGLAEILEIKPAGDYTVDQEIAVIKTELGQKFSVCMIQNWPVKKIMKAYAERLLPTKPLTTRVRIVDALFPLAEGGTACIPGPFGSGKTVFQQSVSRYGDADIVIVAACGERAGEVVETLREFPVLKDPRSGRSLMERTVIICNTSSMPVASREASVYTAMTIGEYYRQMGLRVLVLADSTSRWAQALREMSGRLEEIPGEEAFPAYLGSLIAAFYERAGIVQLNDPRFDQQTGSLTLIGSVSPAGGNFEEPVTQSTLAVVGCFLGLTYARSYAKRFPAISPVESWSKYLESMRPALDAMYYLGWVDDIIWIKSYYDRGQKIGDQMKVVGEEDLSLEDFTHFHKAEFIDGAFFQQNAFSEIDAAPDRSRVAELFLLIKRIVKRDFPINSKHEARELLLKLTARVRDLNLVTRYSSDYDSMLADIENLVGESKMETGL